MSAFKVYWWLGTSLDPEWQLADTEAIARAALARRRDEGALCAVILAPDWHLVDSYSATEEVSLDAVLGRGRHGTPTDDGPRAA